MSLDIFMVGMGPVPVLTLLIGSQTCVTVGGHAEPFILSTLSFAGRSSAVRKRGVAMVL